MNKRVAVLGGNGFIGHHLARRLKEDGNQVLVVDIKKCEYSDDHYSIELIEDLRSPLVVKYALSGIDEVYQLAADMGGCQYVFTGEHDADILSNSALININVCKFAHIHKIKKIFYSSSACMYPHQIQVQKGRGLKESDAYPGNPDSEYGWEKLFSERLFLAYARNYGLNVRIARFHNIFGPEGTWEGGKEKAPAAICRKVAESTGIVDVWGDGEQTRSFLYIDDCIDAVMLLMESDFREPINIGSDESVTIKQLWEIAINISRKHIKLNHVPRPANVLGVHHRNSDNTLIREVLHWEPKYSLYQGMEKTYHWIKNQIDARNLEAN